MFDGVDENEYWCPQHSRTRKWREGVNKENLKGGVLCKMTGCDTPVVLGGEEDQLFKRAVPEYPLYFPVWNNA